MIQARSKIPLAGSLVFCLLMCLTLAALGSAPAAASTRSDVKRAMNRLSGVAGAYAYDITAEQAIAGRRQADARIIASNAKLFTSAAALLRFGTGGRFSTGVWTTGTLTQGVLDGDLYLRGGGGPLFGSADYVQRYFGSRATLEALAANLHKAGITEVTGTVYGDQTAFDTRRGTAYSGWRRSSDIGGTLGGLIVNKGFAAGRWQANPPKYAAQRLAAALRAADVEVSAKAGSRVTPGNARRLAYVRSLPISALVRQMNKPSNNYLAEMLVKSLALPPVAAEDDADGGLVPIGGRRASTAVGARRAVITAGRMRSHVRLIDGSGLSRGDRAAAREVVDLLRGMQTTVAFTDFRASLPIAGVDGTLSRRMRGTAAFKRCQAKTGTLSNVSTLSGYCTTAGGHLVAFSVLQNRVAPWAAHAQQDRVAATIAALR